MIPFEPKNAVDYTYEELKSYSEQSAPEFNGIYDVLEKTARSLDSEIAKLQSGLSDFSQRGGALLTVAGLFALFPLNNFLKTFLIYVFPFLILSILFYFLSLTRKSVVKTSWMHYPRGTVEEILTLQMEVKGALHQFELYKKTYDKVAESYWFVKIFSGAYFISFVIYYYFATFQSIPSTYYSVIITTAIFLCCCAAWYYRLWYAHRVGFGHSSLEIATGGAPEEKWEPYAPTEDKQ